MIQRRVGRFVWVMGSALLLSGCSQPPYSPVPTSTGQVWPHAAPTPAPAQSQYAAVPSKPTRQGPVTSWVTGQPLIRVRVAANKRQAIVGAGSAIRISPDVVSPRTTRTFASPITISLTDAGFVIRSRRGGLRWNLNRLRLMSINGGTLSLHGKQYPAALVVTRLRDEHGNRTNRFDVVNDLGLERYLPGVIAHELYPNWSLAAYKAQAVAARSYAIYEISLHQRRQYDVASTTASQVYGGHTTNRTALRAVAQTFGQVLVYQGRVVPAFYSSTCGGRSQDVTAAFPNVVPIRPLEARRRADYCSASPKFRWPVIVRNRTRLSRRIAAWGAANGNAVARLGELAEIRIGSRSASGRPASFVLYDEQNQVFTLPCEWFRFACDFDAATLRHSQMLPSSDCVPIVSANTVRFTRGRGFGHGVGMCQWGAHGMAQAGDGYRQILSYEYPGAGLRRLY